MPRTEPQANVKQRRRNALAVLLRLRRRFQEFREEFNESSWTAAEWQEGAETYIGPLLQAFPDIIPVSTQNRLRRTIDLAGGSRARATQACDMIDHEFEEMILELDTLTGPQGKLRRRLRPLWRPLVVIREAAPATKVAGAFFFAMAAFILAAIVFSHR